MVNELVCEIRRLCQGLGLERYKFAVHVTYGEKAQQHVAMSSKCLWDATSDGYITVTVQNDSMFCTCQVGWGEAAGSAWDDCKLKTALKPIGHGTISYTCIAGVCFLF